MLHHLVHHLLLYAHVLIHHVPIQMRLNELLSGVVRSDVAIKVFGDDMDTMNATAADKSGLAPSASSSAAFRVSGAADSLARGELGPGPVSGVCAHAANGSASRNTDSESRMVFLV
ncbi:MAG: hypothetical protein Q8K12_04000 [Thiobacillus sp.]|nr:hypothetical protein [Thiobacillus sp.]